MTEFSIISVFLVGLLGGVHCVGMCGSIVGAFTAQQSGAASASGGGSARAHWPFHLTYNGGRLISYTVAGALVGAIGQAGMLLRDVLPIQHLLFALSSLMLVALGLYLAGIANSVRYIERAGSMLWRHLKPLTRNLMPITTPGRALLLGVLWGWLPCGLVYSVLGSALASGNARSGAMIMLAFGLGTLPNLLAMGMLWEQVRRMTQLRSVRLTAGLLIVTMGVYGLIKVGYTFSQYGWTESCHVDA